MFSKTNPLLFNFQRPLDFFILDIYCMSIFNFLEKMFFGHTENPGNKICLNCRTEMSAKPKILLTIIIQKCLKKMKTHENRVLKLHTSLHTSKVCCYLCNFIKYLLKCVIFRYSKTNL